MNKLLCLFLVLWLAVGCIKVDADQADQGQQSQEPCACRALWDPVCGDDGETYSNSGCAACANVGVQCSGECPCGNIACTCPAGGPEVCGTDGVTYPNECLAACEGIEPACNQPCPCVLDDCICILLYDPVCGVDGTTYGNDCFAGCAGVEVACKGECPCHVDDCVCIEIFAPVCGVDGVQYDNECFADCAGIPIDCDQTCPCPCPEGLAACIADPCDVEECPAYPNAQCFSNFCGGCNAVFVVEGEVVDCDLPHPDPPKCIGKDERCNAFKTDFPDQFLDDPECCDGLECCPDCVKAPGDNTGSLAVSSVYGTCTDSCSC